MQVLQVLLEVHSRYKFRTCFDFRWTVFATCTRLQIGTCNKQGDPTLCREIISSRTFGLGVRPRLALLKHLLTAGEAIIAVCPRGWGRIGYRRVTRFVA